jgi:hypothetical protein
LKIGKPPIITFILGLWMVGPHYWRISNQLILNEGERQMRDERTVEEMLISEGSVLIQKICPLGEIFKVGLSQEPGSRSQT